MAKGRGNISPETLRMVTSVARKQNLSKDQVIRLAVEAFDREFDVHSRRLSAATNVMRFDEKHWLA